jgi:GT2 family glycosyltransferase
VELGVDVVMVNYQTPDDASAFIDSYAETRPPRSSLFVANVQPNTYNKVAVETALTQVPGEVYHFDYEDNIGYARACNNAASFGNRRVIAFFNADTRLTPHLLTLITDELEAHKDWGVVGPRQYDDHGRITHGGIFGTEAQPHFAGRWQAPDHGQFNEIDDTAVSVSGSAYFIQRGLWDLLTDCPIYRQAAPDAEGAFLPTPHYYEETFCSYHARAHGFKVVYYGALGMVHRWHKASQVGGYAERMMPISQTMFRAACDLHSIPHD